MQKLRKRNTYTQINTKSVYRNCDHVVKQSCEGRDSAHGLKTFLNNSEEALTGGTPGQNLRVSVVYVLNLCGEPLMPCSPHKARILLKHGRIIENSFEAYEAIYKIQVPDLSKDSKDMIRFSGKEPNVLFLEEENPDILA